MNFTLMLYTAVCSIRIGRAALLEYTELTALLEYVDPNCL